MSVWFLVTLGLPSFAAPGDPPQNVIMLIGDGMGFEQVRAAGMYLNGIEGTLSFEMLPYQAVMTTYSANSSVTDSAAAATAKESAQSPLPVLDNLIQIRRLVVISFPGILTVPRFIPGHSLFVSSSAQAVDERLTPFPARAMAPIALPADFHVSGSDVGPLPPISIPNSSRRRRRLPH